jgi:DNA-binding transcriptional regulator YiaG
LLLDVPLNTLRMWDSGARPLPGPIPERARRALAQRAYRHEAVSLVQLAGEFRIHLRTLQAAARTGRLATTFSTRSVFGRPLRFATRAAVDAFVTTHYRRFAGRAPCPLPLPEVPDDYDHRLPVLRRRLGLTQTALAERIEAAGKAVVYQWESRKRRPSPVYWQRIRSLEQ